MDETKALKSDSDPLALVGHGRADVDLDHDDIKRARDMWASLPSGVGIGERMQAAIMAAIIPHCRSCSGPLRLPDAALKMLTE